MASLTVYSRTGAEVGTYEIEPTDLAPEINKQLLHDVVVMYQSNQRLGTAKTKSRGEVRGSTKKMYRQKGTGNARAGSRRSGIRRGGGHIFAKRPRDWTYRLPRKAVQLATRMALAAKLRDAEVTLIDELKFDGPKTKDMAAVLKALGISGNSLLVTTAKHDINVYKSARNIDRVEVAPVSGLNALNLLRPKRVLITKAALEAFRAGAKQSLRDKPEAEAKPTGAEARAAKRASTARAGVPKKVGAPKKAAGVKKPAAPRKSAGGDSSAAPRGKAPRGKKEA
jgi:large subunit ribosomal protein L4